MPDKKYGDLKALMDSDRAARMYFDELPDYVKDQLMTRGESVNSFDSLVDYAQNITRGDN